MRRNASWNPLQECASLSPLISYEVNGRTIQSCEVERDLGILVDCDLTWRAQVCHQAACANKSLGFIRRNASYNRSTSTRRTLYLGLVRAHFAHATQVCAPQAIELISKPEKNSKTCYQIYSPFTFYHRNLLQGEVNISRSSSCMLLA